MTWIRLEDRPLRPGDALVVVHVQNDFLPGGSLPVPGGDQVVAPLNAQLARFAAAGLPAAATRDWHPVHHVSFRERGGPWPPHCVQRTWGARFAPGLALPSDVLVTSSATDPDREAYSGFDGTDLAERLRRLGVRRLFAGGLATDYCVQYTVRDARALGFDVCVLLEACRAIEAHPGDEAAALRAMGDAGAELVVGAGPGPWPPEAERRA